MDSIWYHYLRQLLGSFSNLVVDSQCISCIYSTEVS